MKYISSILLTSALLLVSCGSMSVDDPNAGALPSDFKVSAYSTLNPDIANYQLRSAVADSNKARKDSLGSYRDTTIISAVKSRAEWAADSVEFLSDSSYVRNIFVNYAGYKGSMWKGVDSLDADQMRMVLDFNLQGKNVAQNAAWIASFPIDSTLIQLQYELYGQAEGRPYKNCQSGTFGKMQDPTDMTQVTAKSYGQKYPDYRPNTYCYNTADGNIYLNK